MAHIVLLLSIPILAYLALAVGSKALELYRLQERSAEIRQEIRQLQDKNEGLQRQIAYLRSDPSVEGIARQQLGLVRPGDTAVTLVSPSQGSAIESPPSSPVPVEPASTPRPNWQKWRDYFFPSRE